MFLKKITDAIELGDETISKAFKYLLDPENLDKSLKKDPQSIPNKDEVKNLTVDPLEIGVNKNYLAEVN